MLIFVRRLKFGSRNMGAGFVNLEIGKRKRGQRVKTGLDKFNIKRILGHE